MIVHHSIGIGTGCGVEKSKRWSSMVITRNRDINAVTCSKCLSKWQKFLSGISAKAPSRGIGQ